MKKITKWLIALFVVTVFSAALAACGGTEPEPAPAPSGPQEITGVTFEDASFPEDGQKHTISVSGTIPSGVSVVYTGGEDGANGATAPGEYEITATLSGEGYRTETLKATLTIVRDESLLDITGVTFTGASFPYDGEKHAISVSGTIPNGVSVAYTGGEDGANGATNVAANGGAYTIAATLTGTGYRTKTLTADLTIEKIAITGVTFTGATYPYDKVKHTIAVVGDIPSEVSVAYTGGEDGANGATNVATNAEETYTITAALTGRNYLDLTLTADLKIERIEITGVTFSGGSFPYDAEEHTISVTGLIPDGVDVAYTGGGNGTNGATAPGNYTVTATLTGRNYLTKTLTARLSITSAEEPLAVFMKDSTVYFQNSLDKGRMYSYAEETLSKVGNDVPRQMISVGSKIYVLSQNFLGRSISSFDGSKLDSLLDVYADSIFSDGTYLYYTVNIPLAGAISGAAERSGIWRVSVSDLENATVDPDPVRVTASRASYAVVSGGRIYFANKEEGDKLYSVSASASNARPTLLYDFKVSDLIEDAGILYFTRHEGIQGAAIYRLDVSDGHSAQIPEGDSREKKITMSKGKNLAKAGDYIYFVNTDLVTTTIFGDGIYRAAADGSGWLADSAGLLTGASKIVDGASDNLFSLATDGTNLYYFRTSDRHLYRCDGAGENETDLMESFTPIEKPATPTSSYSKTLAHDGKIWYINGLDGGKLYRYDPVTHSDDRITGLAVADFAFDGDTLYYSTVRLLTNFDMYRMPLSNGISERISTRKCLDYTFIGDYIYYLDFTKSNTLGRMKKDGSEAEPELWKEESVADYPTTLMSDGKILFVAARSGLLTTGDTFYRFDPDTNQATVINSDLLPNRYILTEGKIWFMNDTVSNNSFNVYDFAADTSTEIVKLGAIANNAGDARGMFVYDGYVYFYRNTLLGDSADKGLYKVSLSGTTATKVGAFEGYYLADSVLVGDKVYFTNVWQIKDTVPVGSGKLCVLDLTTNTIGEVAK